MNAGVSSNPIKRLGWFKFYEELKFRFVMLNYLLSFLDFKEEKRFMVAYIGWALVLAGKYLQEIEDLENL